MTLAGRSRSDYFRSQQDDSWIRGKGSDGVVFPLRRGVLRHTGSYFKDLDVG